MRADLKLQWQIFIAMFFYIYFLINIINVYTREKQFLRVCGASFQSGEKKHGSYKFVFFWHADCYFISVLKNMCGLSAEVVRRSLSFAQNHNLGMLKILMLLVKYVKWDTAIINTKL